MATKRNSIVQVFADVSGGKSTDELLEVNKKWIEALDPATSRTYYIDTTTRQSAWETPDGFLDRGTLITKLLALGQELEAEQRSVSEVEVKLNAAAARIASTESALAEAEAASAARTEAAVAEAKRIALAEAESDENFLAKVRSAPVVTDGATCRLSTFKGVPSPRGIRFTLPRIPAQVRARFPPPADPPASGGAAAAMGARIAELEAENARLAAAAAAPPPLPSAPSTGSAHPGWSRGASSISEEPPPPPQARRPPLPSSRPSVCTDTVPVLAPPLARYHLPPSPPRGSGRANDPSGAEVRTSDPERTARCMYGALFAWAHPRSR